MVLKNKLLTLIILLTYGVVHAQTDLWPFKDNSGTVRRGNITGTVGDFRAWVGGTQPVRFHAGTDFTSWYDVQNYPNESRAVYSVHAGTVHAINTGTCLASYISIQLTNGTIVYYKHIAPSDRDPVTGATVNAVTVGTQVQVGTFLGQMIISSTCAQHVHINDNNNSNPDKSLPGTTNYINNFVRTFHDTSAPDFMSPFDAYGNIVSSTSGNDAVEFRSNGHTFSTQTNLMDQTVVVGNVSRKVVYDKIDILSRIRDRKIHIDGSGNAPPPDGSPEGDNGINKASYQLLNNSDIAVTTEIENINFNTVPPLERALYIYDNRSIIQPGGSRHVYILTNKPGATGSTTDPWDRFFNTTLRVGQTEDWDLTNRGNKDARCIKEAQYPDGEYKVRLRAKDISNQQGTTSNVTTRDASILIDNFRPYVEDVLVRKNSVNGDLVYHGYRKWNSISGTLEFPSNTSNDAGFQDHVWIQITTSEPSQNVMINIPTVDGTTYLNATVVPNTNNTKFILIHDPITLAGSQFMNIQAQDFAGNPLQTDPTLMPVRQGNGTWGTGVSEGIDNSHHFNTGTGTCSGNSGDRAATNGRTSSGCLYADFAPSKLSPAIGEAITFTPVVAGNGVITSSWDFGPGAIPATSTSSGPQTIVYTTSGPKTVSLKICDNTASCITDTQTNVINIGAPPSQLVVNFSADRLGGNIGDNIRLTSSVTGAVGTVSYAWDFGEGVLSGQFSDINPLISYGTPGNKSIQLRVSDANGSVTTAKNNYLIITSPAFNVNVSILSGCGPTGANGSASFSAVVSGGNGAPYDSYRWDFGDGNTSSSSGIVTHTYKKSGKYTVRLTVCDETGCGTGESVNCVTVPSIVDANTLNPDFLIEDILLGSTYSPIQVSLNTPVTFSDATTGGGDPNTFTYFWDFEAHYNNSTGIESANPAIATTKGANEVYYTVAGLKEVSFFVGAPTVSRIKIKTDAINVVKGLGSGRCFATLGEATVSTTCWSTTNLPQFAIPVLKSNCPVAKTEVIYWPTPGQGIVLPNNKLDFAAMGLPLPEFPLTADFSFSVYQNDGISYNRIGYKRQRFTIYGPVTADAGIDKQACLGSLVMLGTSSLDNLSYKWTAANTSDLNFLSSATLANPVFSGTQNGAYTFSLRTTDNQSGCSSVWDNVVVTVDKPTVTSASYALSLDQSLTLNITTSGGFGNNAYSWSTGNNLSSTTISNPIFHSASAGDFDYLVSVTDQFSCQNIAQVHVNVSNLPGALVAKAEAYLRISLSWTDRSSTETGFLIQRSINGDVFSDYATVGSNVTSFQDLNVSNGITYTYRVGSIVGGVASGFSNGCSINTSNLPLFSKMLIPGTIVTYGDYDNDKQLEFGIQNGEAIDIYKYSPMNQFTLWRSVSSYVRTSISADFDNDGDMDIYINTTKSVPQNVGISKMVTNNLSGFSVENRLSGIEQMQWVDCDSDNDVDMVINQSTNTGWLPVKLYKNIGANQFTFSDLTMTSHHGLEFSSGKVISQGDYDNDGDPDIVSSFWNGSSPYELKLFKNNDPEFIWDHGTDLNFSDSAPVVTTEFGDFDNDGWKDILCSGLLIKTTILKNNRDNSFSKIIFNKNITLNSTAEWGDYDSDGDLDFLISGHNGTNGPDYFEVDTNNNGVFSTNQTGTQLVSDWVDFDNDGDLDLIGVGGYIYINNLGANLYKANTAPSAPINLCTYFNGDNVTFSWSPATDTETPAPGLTYNLYVKKDGQLILSPLSDTNSGFRKVVERGNVDHNTSWTLTIPGLSDIEWGVQAVDNQYIGSKFVTSTVNKAFADVALCDNYSYNVTYLAPNIVAPQCPSNVATILPGASITLSANNLIRLLPGASAQRGSIFNAKIVHGGGQVPCNTTSGRLDVEDIITQSKIETLKSSVKIYPNPTLGEVNIEATFSNSRNVELEIINIVGNVLLTKKYDDVDTITDMLDISAFAAGMYLIRVNEEYEVKTFRILKQ